LRRRSYGERDHPDVLLRDFARGLIGQGCDVIDVVQRRDGIEARRAGPARFVLLRELDPEDGEVRLGARGEVDCATQFEHVVATLTSELCRHPDVLILNRYGSMEVADGGLIPVLASAIELDIPVLIGVPDALFGKWLTLASGLAVKLQPNLDVLNDWWRSLRRMPSRENVRPSVCEMFK
jgi:Protein of unknown function (DUF2478)